MLHFITGNKSKFEEVQAILPDIVQVDINLPEVQDMDAHVVIKEKLTAALQSTNLSGEIIVEDTSIYVDCLNGFPGPLIKWFLGSVGNQGLADLVDKYNNDKVTVKTIIGHVDSSTDIHFFEGVVQGRIVSEKSLDGVAAFGWDKIFIPEGEALRYSEMRPERKREISMRTRAAQKLKEFLDSNNI